MRRRFVVGRLDVPCPRSDAVRSFTEECKAGAIRLVLYGERQVADVARSLDVRLAVDNLDGFSRILAGRLASEIGNDLVKAILESPQTSEGELKEQHVRVAELKNPLQGVKSPDALRLLQSADYLVKRSVWIVGGDGWARSRGA